MTIKTPNPAAKCCEHTNEENEDRKCSACGAGPLAAGFCIDGGASYYCSEECLHKEITPEDYAELHDDGNGDSYWTEWEDDDYPGAPDPQTCDIHEAISHAMRSLEAEALDILDECATRYQRELAELRAQIRLDRAAFNSIHLALNNAREHLGNIDPHSEAAREYIEQCEFADMLLAGALRKAEGGAA